MKWDPDSIVTLAFNNLDASPRVTTIRLGGDAVTPVMAWYAAYHSGDRYTVTVDRLDVAMDRNGEPLQ